MGAARERHAASRHSPPAPAAMMDANAEASNQRARAALCMALLTLQYGVQPLISKRFTGKYVIMTSAVLTCELVKCVAALFFMARDGTLWRLPKEWSFVDSLTASASPAAIYALQNTLLQLSYRNLDSLTFSLLNQTKLVFTAFFMFLLLGSRQTKQQIGALFLLLIAAMLLSLGKTVPQQRSKEIEWESTLWLGIIPIISASVLSGLASTLCQWAAQVKRRSTYLMTLEMSTYGSLVLLISMWWSPDGVSIQKRGFFYGWTLLTFIPVIFNAFGGILVGLVTQYSGGIKKGFVIVSALLVTALLEVVVEGKPPSTYAVAALPLVVSSTIIHQNYPYKAKPKTA